MKGPGCQNHKTCEGQIPETTANRGGDFKKNKGNACGAEDLSQFLDLAPGLTFLCQERKERKITDPQRAQNEKLAKNAKSLHREERKRKKP